jgi:uncharacterized protein involved in outer membrane biogenesis
MRIILFTFSFIALLLGAVIIGPSFVDWNKYKTQIVDQVAAATGLEVQVNGDLSVSVLPSPRVKIENLVVVSPKKIQFENLITLKSVEVSVALLPLLQKKIEVSSVMLVEPNIQVEIMKDGTPSWTTDKLSKAKEITDAAPQEMKTEVSKASSNVMDSITLNELEIRDGKVSFINHATGAEYSAQDINLELEADSLNGPFEGDGRATYEGKKITFDVETGKLPKENEVLKLSLKLALPEAGTGMSFDGVVAINAPYDLQGQANVSVKSPQKLAKLFGAGTSLDQAVSLNGLLSADENKIQYNDLKLSLGDFVGNGKIIIDNLKTKNPVSIKGDIKSSSTLNLDKLTIKNSELEKKTVSDDLQTSAKASTKSKSFVPQTLALPMDVNANVQFDVAGMVFQGQEIKGAFLDLEKTGAKTTVSFKALELPGQSKANGSVNVSFSSSSKSPKSGQVIYSDPNVTYAVNGQIGQLSAFLKAFAPKADTSAVTKLYKTAQFDLNGKVGGNAVSLKDSTLKLDQMVVGLGGRYEVPANGGRAKAVLDISAGEIDFDKILQAQNGSKKTTFNDDTASNTKASPKEALKPLQGFSLPLDLTFDVSLQKARINKADLKGLRLTGSLVGKQLKITNASVNDYAGAMISLKGQVANLSDLTGLDLTLYTKTVDVKKLASTLRVNASTLPKDLKALEASVNGKGTISSLGFKANVKAMGGQLDVSGNATDLLGTPSYNNLSIGLNHPNLVKAIQVVSPEFKGQAGLSQPINFRSQANVNGKKIDLSNIVVKLGKSDFDGNLKIDASSKVTSIRGNIQAGKIALDDLLGAKTASAKSSGGGTSSKASSPSSDRWSKDPINLAWMNTIDVDVALSASSIIYGGWNFTKPATSIKIGNGQMTIADMKAGVFGGSVNLDTEVKANPVSLSVSSKMDNIDLEKLVTALSGSSKLKSAGTVSFDMNAESAGASAHALINALNGKANLDGTDVTLKGFDLAKLARGLAVEEKLATSVSSLVDGATSGGQTKFDTVKGDYKITKGVVHITSMVMDSSDAVIKSTGTADLPKWFINVDNVITLKSVPDLAPFEVKIKGPIDKPGNTFGKNILEDYLGDKLKRKLAKELPDILGDDATNVLEGLGLIPKKQAPVAPATVPVEGAVTPEAQPAAPTPKKIEKPEDAINELLNSETPEEALGNVLKGLF